MDMYKPQGFARGPRNANMLWRYMLLRYFLDLLEKRALFFARPEVWKDPYEGFYSEEVRDILGDKIPKYVIRAAEQFSRKHYCVSCWHMNQYESAAMWELYGKEIAIQTDVRRIKESLKPEKRSVSICRVQYRETERPLSLSLCQKRPSFEHEREVRLHVIEPNRKRNLKGTFVSVDLGVLIECVHIAPNVSNPTIQSVKEILTNHGLGRVPVTRSSLYSANLV